MKTIKTAEYEDALTGIAREYFVSDIRYVENLKDSADELGVELQEPGQPMAVSVVDEKTLRLYVQSEVGEEQLGGVVKALGVRWALKDTMSDVTERLDSVKKKLGYCFLKEYSRTVPNVGDDELREDEWALREMERLGLFNE